MALWAGIDEAGYGPMLGPLVVAGTVFEVPGPLQEGMLWERLRGAVAQQVSGSGGRLIIADSKRVYGTSNGLKHLEDATLSFVELSYSRPTTAGAMLRMLGCPAQQSLPPWFSTVSEVAIPSESNASAVESKAAILAEALHGSGVRPVGAWASVVLPEEFNRIVSLTGNKSYLLFQKCGVLLQNMWRIADRSGSFVLVDRHGGRTRYRRLLRDVFPHQSCNVLSEGRGGSVYSVMGEGRALTIAFKKEAERLALPVALASMMAKYIRELYMHVFNRYWQRRKEGLRPTAGYPKDARRFIEEIRPLLEADGVELARLVRCK